MAIRSALARIPRPAAMEGGAARWSSRYFSDGKGRLFNEEEKAAENIYIKKMEREKAEKMKLKAEKEKTAAEKEKEKEKADQKPEEHRKG